MIAKNQSCGSRDNHRDGRRTQDRKCDRGLTRWFSFIGYGWTTSRAIMVAGQAVSRVCGRRQTAPLDYISSRQTPVYGSTTTDFLPPSTVSRRTGPYIIRTRLTAGPTSRTYIAQPWTLIPSIASQKIFLFTPRWTMPKRGKRQVSLVHHYLKARDMGKFWPIVPCHRFSARDPRVHFVRPREQA